MKLSRTAMLQAAKWTAVSNVVSQVLGTTVTFVLAALLNPKEFGTVAMAYLYITFIQRITGFGFNTALIQRSILEKKHLDSVFWLNIGTGASFAMVAILLSGWWSHVNRMPELKLIIIVLSVIVPIEGLSVVQVAILQRRMQFKELAIRDNIAILAGGVTGVTMAFCGFGAWALVFQHIARELISLIALWRISKWRPGFEVRYSAVKDLRSYAVKTLVGRVGTYAQNSIDSLLIGIFFGPVVLGLYRLANRLIEMTLSIIPRALQIVSLPHFSKFQSDLNELNKNFLFGTRLNCVVAVPGIAYMAGASSIILPAIGDQWTEAATVLQILALIGMMKAILLLVGPLLQAVSRPGTYSLDIWILAILNTSAVALAATLFINGTTQQQLISVAALRGVAFGSIMAPLFILQVRQVTKLSLMEFLKHIWSGAAIGALVFGVQWLCNITGIWTQICNIYLTLVVSVSLATAIWFLGVLIFDKTVWELIRRAWTKTREPSHVS